MRLKKVGTIQKYSGKEKIPNEEKDINSKENVEKVEDAKDEITEIPPIMQIDYDELPDGVYDFAGLAELQHRKTRPNPRENEKLLKTKNKKGKREAEKKEKIHKKQNRREIKEQEEQKNIVEEIFEAKKNSEEKSIEKSIIVEEKVEVKEVEKEEQITKTTKENNETLKVEEQKEESKIPELKEEEKKEENKEYIENPVQEDIVQEEKLDQEEIEEGLTVKIAKWFTDSKKFAFIVMLLLGVITQISFLATSRENNLTGLCAILLSAVSIFLLANVLEIKNKIIIFIISLIAVLIPEYNDILITGENAIIYSFSIVLAMLALNLVFVKRNKIISFALAVTMFAIGYKIYQNCMDVFLVIGIIKIIKDIFNRTEKVSKFLLHCVMICAILAVGIFL